LNEDPPGGRPAVPPFLMGLIDFILNLAGLLMWLSWRSVQYDPLSKRTPATLIGTLRPAEPTRWRRWHLLAAIGGLLVARAVAYWLIGPSAHWTGRLEAGATSVLIPIHGGYRDLITGVMLYSFLSFGLALGVVYLWLLFLSILAGPDPIHRLVRVQLGAVDRWPRWLKGLLPLLGTTLLWWPAAWLLRNVAAANQVATQAPPVTGLQHLESALIVGLGGYLVWKYVIGGLLILHLLNTHIYFGKQPFWNYVNATGRTLLAPLRKIPLRAGKVDFAPVAGLALTFLAAELWQRGLVWLHGRLPG